MERILTSILDELYRIATSIAYSIIHELIFYHQPPTLEERLTKKNRQLALALVHQQDMLSYKESVAVDQDRRISEQVTLLAQKDNEIRSLRNSLHSFELRTR